MPCRARTPTRSQALWERSLWERPCVAKGLRSSPSDSCTSPENGERCALLSRRKAAPTKTASTKGVPRVADATEANAAGIA
ncbi:hypothetical protein D0O09_19505 [Pseudomonas putida]|nr:hypothetical protein D0O09_19505 [Pseudomonas putida]